MKTETKEQEKKVNVLKISLIAGGTVVGLWVAYWIAAICYYGSVASEAGQFGDMFGAVNALFTGLAFAGVIVTVYLQSDELRLQRKELELTRNEFKKQNRTLKYQRFETTFFNLVRFHNDIVVSLGGANTFYKFYIEHLDKRINSSNLQNLNKHNIENIYNEVREMVGVGKINSFLFAEQYFGHYVRNFSSIVELALTKKTTKGKEKYLNLYFAQITDYERIFLFFHLNLSRRSRLSYYPILSQKLFFPVLSVIDSNVFRILEREL